MTKTFCFGIILEFLITEQIELRLSKMFLASKNHSDNSQISQLEETIVKLKKYGYRDCGI